MEAFLSSTAGLAVKGALVAAFLDFGFGVFAALKDSTFSLDAIAAFLRKHLVGRVLPVSGLAYMGYLTGDPLMISTAIAALSAYAAETLASIYGSIAPSADVKVEATGEVIPANPIPTD